MGGSVFSEGLVGGGDLCGCGGGLGGVFGKFCVDVVDGDGEVVGDDLIEVIVY